MKFKATIILACYNKEHYIERALKSIIKLSRFNDFEVIIVDDCSTDNSALIIKDCIKDYNNMKLIVLDKGSGGPSKPRNVGMKHAHSPYFIFMDPDDQIINDGYSLLLTKMEKYKSDILIAARIGVDDNGKEKFIDFIDENQHYINENNEAIQLDLLVRRPFILKTIYKRKLIDSNNIWFNEQISTSEDEIFDMTCVAHAQKITKIDDIVYQYTYEAQDSITTKVSLKLYEQLPIVFKELTTTYALMFDKTIIAERLFGLLHTFYLRKLIYIGNKNDLMLACNYIYDTVKEFGFERFEESLISKKYLLLLENIKTKDYFQLMLCWYFRRFYNFNNKRKQKHNKIIKNETIIYCTGRLVRLMRSVRNKVKR